MAATLDAIAKEALVLTTKERLALARRLLVSVESTPEFEVEEAWEEEIQERISRFDAGLTTPVPASQVFARLAQIAPGR